ncbi:MAG: prolyl oligopeptidase family serine peptidase [Thermoanaerobaculia bacterium]
MSDRVRRLLACLACLAGFCAAGLAQTKPSLDSVLDALQEVKSFREAAISPDGARVAWVVRQRDSKEQENLSAIFVAPLSGGKPRRVSAADGSRLLREHSAVFSPDGERIAFLSDAQQERQVELFVAPAAGGAAKKLTAVSGQLGRPKWSPDGRSIAFLFIEGSKQEPGALVAYKPDSGVVEEKIEEQRIAVVNAAGGTVRQVSPANLYVYDYDWSPDGTRFAAEAVEGSGTNNYWVAQLYTVRVDTGAAASIWKPPLQIACPRWSPDGKSIALIHGIMSDEGATGGDIWSVPAAGGPARNMTPGIQASPTALFWRSTGEILFTEHVDGEAGVATLDPSTGRVTVLWNAAAALASFDAARMGHAAVAVLHSFEHAAEVVAGPIGAWKPLTRENAAAQRFWAKASSLHWQNGARRIQGWLLPPRDIDAARRYPMVVVVHGGPSAAATPGWPTRWTAALPSQGYFVFLPNPRGSYGQGEAFTQANVKDFGYGDLSDILSGVDEVVRSAPVDRNRVGVAGWSYGGYMAMWAVTQTQRFKAAVAGAGIADWRSYYGQNRIDHWMLPFFGATVYDDPAVYEKSSPMAFIKNVRTPTLVLHGDRDSEVPAPQGYQFWHALKTLGVPTQLVIYEAEGHAIRGREHQRDILRRTVAWFDKYLK